MRKKIISWLMVMLLVIQTATPVYAAESSPNEIVPNVEESLVETEYEMETVSGEEVEVTETVSIEEEVEKETISSEEVGVAETVELFTEEITEETDMVECSVAESEEIQTQESMSEETMECSEEVTKQSDDEIVEDPDIKLDEEVRIASSSGLNEAVYNRILSFKSVYPEGYCWDSTFAGGKQCYGFALLMANSVFGKYPSGVRSASNGTVSNDWTCYTVTSSNCNSLTVEPGDLIDAGTSSGGAHHTAMVLSVSGSNIVCVQCNMGSNCLVYWTCNFNYNSANATLSGIVNRFSSYGTIRLWKPSEALKISATGYSEKSPCNFSGQITSPANGGKVNARTLSIQAEAVDNYTINTFLISITTIVDSVCSYSYEVAAVRSGSKYICSYEADLPKSDEGWIEIIAKCANGETHSLGTHGFNFEKIDDTTPPVISDLTISDVDGNGYTVSCTVTDNIEVDRVQFPTWTVNDGQDDLAPEWVTNPSVTGTRNGNRFSFRVKDSEHNYERGHYATHIYAFDIYGNCSMDITNIDFQNKGCVVAENTYNGHIYQIIDDKVTWEEAKQTCEEMGGHLVTITSAEEQQVIVNMLSNSTECTRHFIGGYNDNGTSHWVTGESFGYANWAEREPNNSGGIENVYEICNIAGDSYGKWNDCASSATGRGFICEFDADEVTAITLSETEVTMGIGKTKQIEATLSPEGGRFPSVIWSSGDENIVTVADGVITAVGFGTTKIWAECGEKKAECTVTVVKPIEGISINTVQKNLFKNETYQLVVGYLPEDATEHMEIVWTSSNPQVASVNEEGVVTAHSAGSTKIYATLVSDVNIQIFCEVIVESYVVYFETNGGTGIAPVECGKTEYLTLEEPYKEGYAFTGWYRDAECTIPWDEENDVVNSNMTLYAGWMEYHEGLWIADIPAQDYTGKAVKPEVTVYHDAVKLEKGKDYTVNYKNNKNANEDSNSAKAPTVIVTGKGNYQGKETATFVISKKDLNNASVVADDIFTSFNGKAQTPKPIVKDNKIKLKNGKDYYIQGETQYMQPGSYLLTLVGMGNYTGSIQVSYTICTNSLISKASVSKVTNQMYTGKEIQPTLVVKHNGRVLSENYDYTVAYENNIEVGTATAIISGINNYSGQKKISFKILGTPINTVNVYGIKDLQYNGESRVQEDLRIVSSSGKILTEDVDYTISYKNNKDAGMATLVITGLNEYSGTVKKNFKITKYDILLNSDGLFCVADEKLSVAYEKDGSKPNVLVTFNGKKLNLNEDYNTSYQQNKAVTSGVASATMTITGKGNYTGKVVKNFEITTSNLEENVKITVADKAFLPQKGGYKEEPVLIDSNNKKLTKGKDYSKELRYVLINSDGTETDLGKDEILNVGSIVKVYVEGIGNYTGTLSATYRITTMAFNKTKVKIVAQEYTGKPVTLDKNDITIKYGGTVLADNDYEIISYSNNINTGTAKVVLKGVGNYGGTKTVNFKISKKFFLWWWK